ncbi:MAG: Penicillin-binding protein 1A [Gemmatimonadaceae bacterium]|nr:Penicillin-binding protein 1A [Gemmatimonadaceae bacterium]
MAVRLPRLSFAFFRRHPRATRWVATLGTFVIAFGLGIAFASWQLVCRGDRCPSLDVLDTYSPNQTSRLYAIDGRFVAEIGQERRTLVELKDIPRVVREAFVITEDKRFYHHNGIDWLRIPGSAFHNLLAGSFAQGFSTITMQLARNVFPDQISREKSLVRKLKEIRVATAIESKYSKDHILELYLNQINLGSGAYGVETASQRYFGKSVREVNLAEAATLAALPKAPGRYNPRRYPERAVQRRNTIVELMRREGAVDDAEASLARAYPLRLARREESGDIAPYFVDWVRRQLEARFGDRVYEQGLRVYTTLDMDMQSAADRALENQLRAVEGGKYGSFKHTTFEQYVARGSNRAEGSEAESPYLQGAFVAVDPRDGAVRALVGGRDFDDSKFNRATQALRQPGSTFKPLVYATAIQHGMSPATMIDDSPVSLPQIDGSEWTPQNFDNKFDGPMTIRRGLMESRNIIAIKVGMNLGAEAVVDEARRFGITTPIPPYPSIAIGSADVYPIELIGAYTTFANLGIRSTPHGILRVEDAEGNMLWRPQPKTTPVLSPSEAWLMVSMMKDVVQRGTAAGSVWGAGFRLPSGGKTGTTNDGADVWYVGYTADLVAGVWMGFDKPKKIMTNAQGGRLAAPAYTAFMMEAYRRRPVPPDWPRPESIVARVVSCGSEHPYVEYFIPGTEPGPGCAGSASNPFAIPTHEPAREIPPPAPPVSAASPSVAKDTANPFRIPPMTRKPNKPLRATTDTVRVPRGSGR